MKRRGIQLIRPDTDNSLMQRELQRHNIVLLGVGHTNAHVLKMWRMQPLDGANLICVSDFPLVSYSGMLPGVLAGLYPQEQMEIDLVRLCTASGARLIVDRVTGVDVTHRELQFGSRPPLRYDWLSIGIGSRPRVDGIDVVCPERLLAIKPMQTFLQRLDQAFQRLPDSRTARPTITVIGGGVGGIEIACCLRNRLQQHFPGGFSLRMVSASEVGSGLLPATVARVGDLFRKRDVELVEGSPVGEIGDGEIVLQNGRRLASDLNLLATGAVASEFLKSVPLPRDARGFLLTRATLQSIGNDRVFAVGDSGTLEENPTEKAGVFAVRQGPILWKNLRRSLQGRSLMAYRPQTGFLKLLNQGDGSAIAEYMGRSLAGRWAWKLKDRIDRRFMSMYQDYRPMPMGRSTPTVADEEAMRCLGCGGKLGGLSLRQALERIDLPGNDRVVIGLEQSDDAAVVRVAGPEVTVTTDFFAAPFDDPFTNGRIAALNAASDCFAMNARPTTALTLAQIPLGHPRSQADVLTELVAGAAHEFSGMGVAIVGGHTIEGPRLTIGFTVIAEQQEQTTRKSGLKPGDQLILTKPLGTGILLAALMRAQCQATWYGPLVQAMVTSNRIALDLGQRFPVSSLTDVTGFGLAGHLFEMLQASQVSARLELASLPLLPGVTELLEQGVESTLATDNREFAATLVWQCPESPSGQVLFDPQTSGGLLLGVAAERTDEVLEFLQSGGWADSRPIGTVEPMERGHPQIRVV